MKMIESIEISNNMENMIFIILDLSGYTKFVTNCNTNHHLTHSQKIITKLFIEMIPELKKDFEISKLEGDAVFLYKYLKKDDLNDRKENFEKIMKLFNVFDKALKSVEQQVTCNCDVCRNVGNLKIKVVVHTGKALHWKFDRFDELLGRDIITLHRLLKNSVRYDSYILFTESAFNYLSVSEYKKTEKKKEIYDIGEIKTYYFKV